MTVTSDRNYRQQLSTSKAQKSAKKHDLVMNAKMPKVKKGRKK